ncbi:hypothetical protein D3C81_1830750 [compost metagenome]
MQAIPFGVFQVHTVGKYAFSAGHTVVMVNIEIIFVLWIQGFHPSHFILVFRQVGMQVNIRIFLAQALHHLQLFR